MYYIPGYVSSHREGESIIVSSELLHNAVRLFDPAIQEEYTKLLHDGGCQNLSSELTRFLHNQEMLADEEELTKIASQLYDTMKSTLLITMMPTEGCNFRCPYCYEDHKAISMSRRNLDKILEYISCQVPHYRHVNISWFGGEPTLCRDTILEVSDLIHSLQETTPFTFSSNMTTNGYLLGVEHFKEYFHAGVTEYQITLDGWDHDKMRPHVSGSGTLQKILDNLLAISSLPAEEYPYSILIRHNILATDEDYSWYDYLKQLFGTDKRFSVLIRPVCDWGGESVQSLNLLNRDNSDALVSRHVAYLKEIGLQCKNLDNSLFANVCNASYPNSMIFRSDGSIEKCTICLGHPKNRIGYVDSEKGVVVNQIANKAWDISSLKPYCFRCTKMLSCFNSGCKRTQLFGEKENENCPFQEVHITVD